MFNMDALLMIKEYAATQMSYMRSGVINMALYINSTIRKLHTRVKEHTTSKSNSVCRHTQICQGDLSTTILGKGRDLVEMRQKEALLINVKKSNINTKEERECIKYLIL